MDIETYYVNVTVDYDKNKVEKLMKKVDEFNEYEGYMALNCSWTIRQAAVVVFLGMLHAII